MICYHGDTAYVVTQDSLIHLDFLQKIWRNHGDTAYVVTQDRANEIVKVMLDPINRQVITCIKDEPKSIHQIHEETEIPASTVYRRLCKLDNKRLILLSGDINDEGRKYLNYQSKIRKVITIIEDNDLDVKIYSNLKY